MIGMSDEHVLGNFKQAFPPNIEAQLLGIDDTDVAVWRVRVLVARL